MKPKEASDFIPFDHVAKDGNYCITAYGDVVFAMEVEMKEVYTMASGDGDAGEAELFYHDWKKTLSMLPEKTMVQKISKFYTLPHTRQASNGNKTKRWNEDMFLARDVVFEKTYIVVSFQFNSNMGKAGIKSLLSRVEKFKGIEYLADYIQQFEAFSESLKTCCNSVTVLDSWDVLSLFSDIWNQGKGDEYLDDIEITENGLKVGASNVAVLTSRKLPSSFDGFTKQNRKIVESEKLGINRTNYRQDSSLATSFLFPLGMGIPVDHILVETIRIEGKEETETRLDKEYQRLNFLVGLKMADAIRKRRIIDEIKEHRLEMDGTYASWGVTVLIKSEDKDKLTRLTNIFVDVAQKQLGMVMAVENYGAWKQFYASMPGCARLHTKESLRLGFLEIYAYMTHVESFKKGNSKGMVMVDLFGRPFIFDDWDEENKYCEARNGVVFAPTGQGKSFLINHVLDQAFWNGDVVFLIDVGGSYKRITSLNKGVYVDSRKLDNLQFNPFLDCYKRDGIYFPELDDSGQKDAIYLDFMTSLICACWYGSSEEKVKKETLGAISKTVKAYFKHVNETKAEELNFDKYYHFVLNHYKENEDEYAAFLDIGSFKMLLNPFTVDGEYGFLLNGRNTIDISNRWITFDLVGILNNKNIKSPVLLIIMQLFQRTMNHWYGTNCRMFIEEAVDFLQGGFFADYIGSLYRKIRKMGGQVFIVTQSIQFLDRLDPLVKASILGNTEIRILLNHAKVSHLYEQMQRELSLSNSEMDLLKNQTVKGDSKYRIAFMKFGSMPGFLFRHEVSPETFSLYQTNAKDIQKIDDLIKSTGSIDGAVASFVEQNN